MDSLRPDRDEVDSFKKNRTTKAKTKSTTHSGAVSAPSRSSEAKHVTPKQSADLKPIVVSRSAPNTLLGLIVVILIVAAAGAGWVYNEQKQELNVLRVELKDALGFIRQSKLLMARFEGKLSETGVEMTEGDTEAKKKLKFLDSEVRKLWGVAYDRNRKSIGVNDGLIRQHASELKNIAVANKKQTTQLDGLLSTVNIQQSSTQLVQSELLALKGSNEQLSTQIKEVEDASNSLMLTIRQEINQLAKDDGMVGRVQQNERAIEANDASRLQLNERYITLDRKLNDLQLSIKSIQSGGKQ
jgi:hypothetical protein